jgi:hypothetical protein
MVVTGMSLITTMHGAIVGWQRAAFFRLAMPLFQRRWQRAYIPSERQYLMFKRKIGCLRATAPNATEAAVNPSMGA